MMIKHLEISHSIAFYVNTIIFCANYEMCSFFLCRVVVLRPKLLLLPVLSVAACLPASVSDLC